MTVLFKILQVVLAFCILIFVHELGHFLFAKLFRIRVEKFYLFFDVGGVRLFSTKNSRWFTRIFPRAAEAETDFGIGWLPLGGYCKICGMIDESMDKEALKGEPQPWEFRTHPSWQRLLVMAGGVMFNFILAIAIFTGILASRGESYIANEGNAIYVNDLSYEMGFRSGDRILRFDDYVPESFMTLQSDLARRNVRKAVVLRGRDTLEIYIDRAMMGEVMNTSGIFDLAVPFVVDSVSALSPNVDAGLLEGDRIIALDGHRVEFVQDSRQLLSDRSGNWVDATVLREKDTLFVALRVDTLGRIGVYMQTPGGWKTREYSFLEAIPASLRYSWNMVTDYVRDLRLVATPSTGAYKSVGSFIAIGQVFPDSWDWLEFFYILALLSVMLGVMNLIPIPGLDGGHIVFTLWEMLTGKKPSDRFMYIAQLIGMILLFGLMFLAFGNDITRLIK